jgi:hypothetical protein
VVIRSVLGLSVGSDHVRAVLWWRGAIRWAGIAGYGGYDALAEAIGRLAAEAGAPVRRARLVLERDVVQLRSVVPAPPLKAAAMRRYVALEAPRLFRKNGSPLVTDGIRLPAAGGTVALWAGAVSEPLTLALLAGCAQAGLVLESLGPAADVLPNASCERVGTLVFPNGGTTEVLEVGPRGTWQSRFVRGTGDRPPSAFHSALAALGEDASHFAAAYAAAVALPRLSLLPRDARSAHDRRSWRRVTRLLAAGTALWLLAAGAYVGRLAWTRAAATRALEGAAAAVDSAIGVRRELALAEATLATLEAAQENRSRHLALLSALTGALGDSTYVIALQIMPDGVVRVAGYAPGASRVVSALEQLLGLSGVRLEGPVTRERGADGIERDRFAIVAHVERAQ